MSYQDIDESRDTGEPFFMFRFTQDGVNTDLTNYAYDITMDDFDGAGNDATFLATSIAMTNKQSAESVEASELTLTFPISNVFARTYLTTYFKKKTDVIIWRCHFGLLSDYSVYWRGRIISHSSEGQTIELVCEDLYTTLETLGLRAMYQRTCRHVLYGTGCGLDIADWQTAGTIAGITGYTYTVAAAAGEADGYYKGGIITHNGNLGFIIRHVGNALTLSGPLEDAAVDDDVLIAPGCDLSVITCADKFDNAINHGGFPFIPDDNPLDGGLGKSVT